MNFPTWPWFSSEPDHLKLGRWGEKQAERHLKKQGVKILGRRVRVGKHDELDLLARAENVLVVIEVKTRSREGLRPARDAVDKEKQLRLNRAALAYARKLTPRPEGIRFDIVEVVGRPGAGNPVIRHHPGAFGLHHGFRY
ncbi:YraN family protein [Kiritimatiellaeota bacterium B1221]|nr:YraN family protein [Kiritimatiellaeota bacterium B1221]